MKKVSSEERRIVKQYSPEDTRVLLLQKSKVVGDLGDALARCSEILSRPGGSKRDKERTREELQEEALPVMFGLEVETHVALMESFNAKYRGMAKELCAQMIRE